METLRHIWNNIPLRRKIFFTLGIIVIFRVAAHITVPGVDPAVVMQYFADSQAASILSALTGGSMSRFSVVAMGLAPYISASIIVQLMTVVLPKLEQWKNEGESGQRRITSLTRWLTLPLALAQSYGVIYSISGGGTLAGFIDPTSAASVLPAMLTITAGTVFLVWLGELITEQGIGNGISLLIFTGIVSAMPGIVASIVNEKVTPALFFALVMVVLLVMIVLVMEAQRPIPIVNTSRNTTGERSNLPIRLLQAGMIPIIFAISLLTFPSILADFLQNADSALIKTGADWWTRHFNPQSPTLEYAVIYFLLIVLFSFFYVSITFRPEKVAENIQKRGGFIPGIRPGSETATHLGFISNRMNFWGGVILGTIALVPLFFTMFTVLSPSDLIISGSGLIIVVGVVLEIIRQVNSQLVSQNYDRIGS